MTDDPFADPIPAGQISMLEIVLTAHHAGLCVVPPRQDGSKAPAGKWLPYQAERSTIDEIHGWYVEGRRTGIGVICGEVSGGLEMFELEGAAVAAGMWDELCKRAEQHDTVDVVDVLVRIGDGYFETTPSGGIHLLYHCDDIAPNQKLARAGTPDNDGNFATWIETRGEGGFVVVAPSHGAVHPSGRPWVLEHGGFDSIATITADERAALFEVARSFDEGGQRPVTTPEPTTAPIAVAQFNGHQNGSSWFDDVVEHLKRQTTTRQLLEHYGWTFVRTDRQGRELMCRPGKEGGVSGSINNNGRLMNFSSTAPFSAYSGPLSPTHDQLDIIAAYEYRGDRQAAARATAEVSGILKRWQRERDDRTDVEGLNLPDEFWTARPALAHIRAAAHSRARSADAVFGFVLARLAVCTPPTVTLPAIVGGLGSLNLLVALIGPSGSGKTTAGPLAAELIVFDPLDDNIRTLSLGSGEGLIEAFFGTVEEVVDGRKKSVKRQVRDRALFLLDEGQALAEMGGRRGATLLPTIRTAWSGAQLGQANATADTTRQLTAHSYRVAAVAGFQPEHAAALLNDVAGGTPQRFLFMSATDPSLPDVAPPWPGQLRIRVPSHELTLATEVADTIRAEALAVSRGERTVADLDAHANLTRLKVAGLLAILDGRGAVTEADWRLAGTVWAASRAVRDDIVRHAHSSAALREQAITNRLTRRELAIEESKEDRARSRMGMAMRRRVAALGPGPVKRGELSRATASRDRQLVTVDDAIAHAVAERWLERADDDGFVVGADAP